MSYMIRQAYQSVKKEMRMEETLLEYMRRAQEQVTRANQSSQKKLGEERKKVKKFQRQARDLRSQRDTAKSALKRERR